ncbi:MAG: histidine kinase, partial [Bryobacteraceae bacterium]
DYNRMRAVGSLTTESLLSGNFLAATAAGPTPDLVPISSLRAITTAAREVRIRGVVTLTDPTYVQDSTGGIAVDLRKPRLLNLGDEIEVTGTPTGSEFAPRLQASAVHLLWDRTLLVPLSISSTQAASGMFDSSLVEVRGFLRSKSRQPDGTVVLTIGDESQSFTAVLKHTLSSRAYDRWEPGSWLRVHGICVIHRPSPADNSVFTILARSPDDIEVLAGPPWWSGERVFRLIVPALLLILSVFVLYVRIERWKMRGILNERERLAHDMHDTLAQSFAGVGFHLQGIRNSLRGAAAPGAPGLMEKLDVACELVAQTHREASANIAALHPDADEGSDLLVALEHYVIRMFNPGNSPLVITREGSPRQFSLPVRDALFQIGREAISNVIRHSHASHIALSLRYEMYSAVLEIRDDGIGFVSQD